MSQTIAIEIGKDLHYREIYCENIDVLVLANGLQNYLPIKAFEKIKSCIATNDSRRLYSPHISHLREILQSEEHLDVELLMFLFLTRRV